MYRRSIILVILLLLFAAEAFFARQFYIEIVPFPEDEWWMTVVNNCLRDLLLAGVAGLLYFRRNRLADRTKRYFPVVVIGVLYLLIAGFMVNQLSLDKGFLTVLAVLTGLNNNIVLVLLAAMCYHKWPSMLMKSVYFAVYFITALTMIFDAFYFWQTSMHVESVLFKNLNIYAVQGVLSGMTAIQLAGIGFAVAAVLLLFRVTKPQKRKPNFAWSLLCVSVFFLGLNLSYWSMVQVNKYILTEYVCVWGDETSEMIRSDYRNLLTTPVNINFASKMLFDTDKIARRKHIEQRPLTAKDERVLKELGILRTQQVLQPLEAQYDKIVLLVLESVHRDYIGFYNKNIPQETTPFLDSLLAKYPRLDNYYSSAIPTTQGLNATFRSHLIFDEEINGVRQMESRYLMEQVSFVFQDVYLFKQSIRDNIRLGNQNASDEQIQAAAKAAQCHDFIMALPNGYDTVIGEQGIHLSGGEQQRIAIARAIVKDAPVIVLDEATAFADPENEHLIQKAFEKLMQGKTVIIIAHRLSTVRNADHIIVMDNGRVAEEGSHDALLQKGGRYASMWKTYNETASWTMEKEVPVNG